MNCAEFEDCGHCGFSSGMTADLSELSGAGYAVAEEEATRNLNLLLAGIAFGYCRSFDPQSDIHAHICQRIRRLVAAVPDSRSGDLRNALVVALAVLLRADRGERAMAEFLTVAQPLLSNSPQWHRVFAGSSVL